ncbi:hypothetical protein PHMEG_00032250, partial [Phytophthora megakarya]
MDDCDARVFRYFQDFTKIVEENGLQGLIGKSDPSLPGYKDRMKARCRLLIENLQPVVLKEQIERLVELERRDCKTDDVALFNLILVHTKAQQRFHHLSKESGTARSSQRQSSAGAASTSGQKQGASSTKPPRVSEQQDTRPGSDRNKATSKSPKTTTPPIDGCLVCHGPHWMRECPTATEEQREEALARYRAAKDRSNSVVRSKVVKARDSANTVKINNLLEVIVIPSGVVHSLMALQPDLPVRRLHAPTQVVVADGRRLECDSTVEVDLQLNTAAGVVNVPHVTCVVMASDEEELLLGKDILSDLGINVDDMLAQLAHGADFVDDGDNYGVGDESQEHSIMEDTQGKILDKYPDVWQDSLNDESPREWSRIKRWRHSTKMQTTQRQFIREHVALLSKSGLIRENRAARWASPVVPVRKPGSKTEFRLTIDYEAVNRATVPLAGTMPNAAA